MKYMFQPDMYLLGEEMTHCRMTPAPDCVHGAKVAATTTLGYRYITLAGLN